MRRRSHLFFMDPDQEVITWTGDRRQATGDRPSARSAAWLPPRVMAFDQGASAAFPRKKGFLWAAATAAYQVEGNNTNSDMWLLEALAGTLFKERSGDACDHYHRYEEDMPCSPGWG